MTRLVSDLLQLGALPARWVAAATETAIGRAARAEPRPWAASDWTAMVIPYLAYSALTSTLLQGLPCRD